VGLGVLRYGWGLRVACVREREALCGLTGLYVALLWKRSAMVQMGRHGRLGNGVL